MLRHIVIYISKLLRRKWRSLFYLSFCVVIKVMYRNSTSVIHLPYWGLWYIKTMLTMTRQYRVHTIYHHCYTIYIVSDSQNIQHFWRQFCRLQTIPVRFFIPFSKNQKFKTSCSFWELTLMHQSDCKRVYQVYVALDILEKACWIFIVRNHLSIKSFHQWARASGRVGIGLLQVYYSFFRSKS